MKVSTNEDTYSSPERFDGDIQLATEKYKRNIRKAPSFSGPLMLPNRASANSLSAPIKSSGGFRDSLDDKSRSNMVQIKGRFSVTSENVDLVKDIPICTAPKMSFQGSPIRKCASVGDWFDSIQLPVSQSEKDMNSSTIPACVLMPHLQNLIQQMSFQQDLVMSLLNSLQQTELAEAVQTGMPSQPSQAHSTESDMLAEIAASERERLLLVKISELQARMISLTDEVTAAKLKHVQLQQQLNAAYSRDEVNCKTLEKEQT